MTWKILIAQIKEINYLLACRELFPGGIERQLDSTERQPANAGVKNSQWRKYLELTRELKKLWNMKVTIIPIVIGAFDMVTKE